MSAPSRGVPPWVWVVVSVVLIAGLAMATCAIGVGVLAPRGGAAVASASAGPAVDLSTDEFVMVQADKTQAPADIFAAAAVSAVARGLRPFVYATATWCEPCQKLNRAMSDPRMKDAFAGTYVVKLDIDDFDAKALAALGMRVRAVPSFFALGEGGMPTGRMMIGDWGPDVPENMAPALKGFFGSRSDQ